MKMKTIWLESEEDFRRVAPAWDRALRASNDDNPFLLSDFILTWWKFFSKNRALSIAAAFDGEDLVGGLPLYAENMRGSIVLRFPGAIDFGVANYTNFFACRSFQEVIQTLLAALNEREGWNLVYLDRLYITSDQLHALIGIIIKNGFLILSQEQLSNFLIDVPESLEEYLSKSSKNLRKNIHRSYRLAKEKGNLHIERIQGKDEVTKLFDYYVELSKSSFRARRKVSAFEDERLCGFFRELLVRFDDLGILDAFELKINKEIIAVGICYSLQNNLNYIMNTFDVRFDDIRPGHLLTAELLKQAIERDMPLINFQTGHNLFKRQWSNRLESVYKLNFGRDSWANRGRKVFSILYNYLRTIPTLRAIKRKVIF